MRNSKARKLRKQSLEMSTLKESKLIEHSDGSLRYQKGSPRQIYQNLKKK